MSDQQGPRHRVIAPVTSGPRRGPKMGRLGIALLALLTLVGLLFLLCGPPPRPRAVSARTSPEAQRGPPDFPGLSCAPTRLARGGPGKGVTHEEALVGFAGAARADG